MDWDAVGAIAETVGVVAVVISLVYVAMQIKQSTEEAITARTQNLIEANSQANAMVAADDDLANIIMSGLFNYGELPPAQQLRFGAYMFALFANYDFAYHQYLAGKIEPVFWANMEYEMPVFINLPGAREWWDRDKVRFSEAFAKFMDERMTELPAEPVPTVQDGSNTSTAESVPA